MVLGGSGEQDRTLRMGGLEMEKGEMIEHQKKHLQFVNLGVVPTEVTLEKTGWC